MGGHRLRVDHVLGDFLPHHGHRFDCDRFAFHVGRNLKIGNVQAGPRDAGGCGDRCRSGCGSRDRAALDEGQNVLLGDPARDSLPLDPGDVDVVLGGDLPHHRGRAHPS